MGANDFSTNSDLKKQIYLEKTFKETLADSFFSRFWSFPTIGKTGHIKQATGSVIESSSKMPIFIKRDLTKVQGDTISFSMVMALTGAGITGSSQKSLEGNEEEMKAYKFSIELEEYAHAVKDVSPLGRKKVMFHIEDSMKDQLAGWGVEKLDKLLFAALENDPTTIIYQGVATTDATLTATDKLTAKLLSKANIIAKTRSGGDRYIIEPLTVKGKKFYVAVCHPDILADLKEDMGEAWKDALPRNMDNPLFAGAEFVTADGVIVYESERSYVTDTWGAGGNVPGGYVSFFGAKAICLAMGITPQMNHDTGDYGRAFGYSYQMMLKAAKPQFNGKDYGSLQIRVARTKVA